MSKTADPTDFTELEALHRAKWTAEKRKQYLKEHPENFAGPDGSYPIEDGGDVEDAWGLAGHADNPDAVRAKIKSIAKRLGLTSSLPDTAKEDDANKDRAIGAQSDDESHDNDDEQSAETRAAAPGIIQQSDRLTMALPLTRIDAAKRTVWGQATAEVPDSYGTIFGYYPDGWKKWRGNIREQHDSKKAVGTRIELECDDMSRAVYVGSHVSRGAQDTWLKVEDNVLTGYSASIIPDAEFGTDPRRWPKKEYQGKQYPYLPRYTVAELSLVDNPSCPGCDIAIVRADGFVTDVTEEPEPEQRTPEQEKPATLERAGKSISAATKSKLHESIGHTLQAAKSQMQNCAAAGCEDCQSALKTMDPDDDGDIDAFGGAFGDTDGDAASLYGDGEASMERVITGIVERVVTQQIGVVYARLQGIAGQLSRANVAPVAFEQLIESSLTRALESAGLASKTSLDEVRADVSAVKGQVETIAKQPMPGAPIMNAGTRPGDAQKRLPTDPYQAQRHSGSSVYDAIAEMSARGQLDTMDKQVEALHAGLMAQQRKG